MNTSRLGVVLVAFLGGLLGACGGGSGGGGEDSDEGGTTNSLDIEWLHPLPAGGDYVAMAQGGDVHVVVGSPGRFLRSANGGDWTAETFSEQDDLNDVAFIDGGFVAIGKNDTRASVVYTSSDGEAWTRMESSASSFTDQPSGISWDGSQYVIAGYDGVSTNTDLTDADGWTLAVDATKSLSDVACNDMGECVAVGNLDGVTNSHTIHYRDGNGAWSEEGPSPVDSTKVGDLHAIAWTGQSWVAVGANSTILSSTNGQTWDERENVDSTAGWGFSEAVVFRDVVGVGSDVFAVGSGPSTNEVAVVLKGGTDGTGWSVIADKTDWGPIHGVYEDDADTGWVVGADGDIHSTVDAGNTWADATTLLTPDYLVRMAFDDSGRVIASGGPGTTLRRNADGSLDWFDGSSLYQAELAWDGQRFVAFGRDGSTFGVSSDGGENWVESDTSVCEFWGEPEALYNGSDFVVSSDSGVCVGNPDGDWARYETGYTSYSGSEYLNGIAFDGTTYVVVGNSGHLAISLDGVNWTVQNTPVDSTLNDVAWTGTQFVAVGNDDVIMTSPAGRAWTEPSGLPNASFQHIAADADGGILMVESGRSACYSASSTLTDCEMIDPRLDKTIYDAEWNDGAFYAAGDDGVLLKLTP